MADVNNLPNLEQLTAAFRTQYAPYFVPKRNRNPRLGLSNADEHVVAEWMEWVEGGVLVLADDFAQRRVGTGVAGVTGIAIIGGRWVISVDVDPEGNVAAPMGSIAMRDQGSVYRKATGSGTSGWEPVGDISSAAYWETVREVNFALWAEQNFTSNTTVALDDGGGALTWTIAGTANANATADSFRRNDDDLGHDGEGGVRILHDQAANSAESNSTSDAPKFGIALGSLIPSYDETASYLIECQITRITESGTPPTSGRVGMVVRPHPSSPIGTGRTWEACYVRTGANNWEPSSAANDADRAARRTDNDWGDGSGGTTDVLAIEVGPQSKCVYTGLYAGGWPDESALDIAAYRADTASTDALLQALNERTMYLWIANISNASVAGSIDFMAHRIRVRKRVRG